MRQFYGTPLSANMIEKPQGNGVVLICQNVPIARTGSQQYLESEVRIGGDPSKVMTLKRLPQDVSDPATIASFEGSPITDEHTPTDVVPENYAMYQKGHLQNLRWVDVDGHSDRSKPGMILADFYITDPVLQQAVRSGEKREVSCGYGWKPRELPDGQIATTMIRANHVAVVERGKGGALCRINDAATVVDPPADVLADTLSADSANLFLSVLYDAMPLCIDEHTSLTLSDGAKPPELFPLKKGTRMKNNAKPSAIGSYLRTFALGILGLKDSAGIDQTVDDALPAAHAAFLADCDDLEDGKKVHQELDADNAGGPSDGDADNKMKAQDAKIAALTDTVTALQKQLTDAVTAASAAAAAAASASTLTDADKALAQLDKLIGEPATTTTTVQDGDNAQVFSPTGQTVQTPLTATDRLAILKDFRPVVLALKDQPDLQKQLTDRLLIIGGYNADSAAQTMTHLAAAAAANHAQASFAGQQIGVINNNQNVQAALDAMDPTK